MSRARKYYRISIGSSSSIKVANRTRCPVSAWWLVLRAQTQSRRVHQAASLTSSPSSHAGELSSNSSSDHSCTNARAIDLHSLHTRQFIKESFSRGSQPFSVRVQLLYQNGSSHESVGGFTISGSYSERSRCTTRSNACWTALLNPLRRDRGLRARLSTKIFEQRE